jgi:hypothetical protein
MGGCAGLASFDASLTEICRGCCGATRTWPRSACRRQRREPSAGALEMLRGHRRPASARNATKRGCIENPKSVCCRKSCVDSQALRACSASRPWSGRPGGESQLLESDRRNDRSYLPALEKSRGAEDPEHRLPVGATDAGPRRLERPELPHRGAFERRLDERH